MKEDKTLIHPPLYLASTTIACWRCGSAMPAVGLIAPNAPDAQGEVCSLSDIVELPDTVLHFIQARFPCFKLTFSKTTRSSYLANTCPKCKVISGDFYLHSEPGGAFFPTTEEEAKQITLEVIPLQGPVQVRAGLSMGTGDIILQNGKKKSAEPGNRADCVQPPAPRLSVPNG